MASSSGIVLRRDGKVIPVTQQESNAIQDAIRKQKRGEQLNVFTLLDSMRQESLRAQVRVASGGV